MQNNSIFNLQKRVISIFMVVALFFILITVRLFYVQVIKGKWLQAKATEQWYRDLPLNAKRGDITDRNGVVIATSYTSYDVYVRPSMVKNAEEVALTLNSILGIDASKLLDKITNKKVSEVSIQLQIDEVTANKIIEANLSGVLLSENTKRYYPYGDFATQVLGFTTIDNIGQAGLENYYNTYLTGVNGKILTESDVKGVELDNSLVTYVPSISGCNLELTVDAKIQSFCESALLKLMEEQKPKTATAIVMDPNTGEILAMSSKPSFDLNEPPRNDVTYLMETVRNLSVVDVYEPGSTFKVLTMATAIEEGVAELSNSFYCPGFCTVDGEKIKCWKSIGHGSQDLTDGLCNSCNCVFVDLALRLGSEKLYESFERYGLGDALGVDFTGEGSGILMDSESAKTVDLARMGFGQAIAVTPLQLISAICSVINGGSLMQPYFVSKIYDENNGVIYENSPTKLSQTISKETSEKIKVMFEEVVKNYSGIQSFIPGYRVGGKTGTSQKYKDGKISGEYIASFVGGFPADNPEYVVLVIADEPSMGNYYGSIVATPYAKMIIENIIDYKNYEPQNLEEDLKKLERNIVVPNFVGKSLTDAVQIIKTLGLQYEIMGDGLFIKQQSVAPDELVYSNSIIVLGT